MPLTRKVIKKRQRKTDCKVSEFVEGTIADSVMAEYRQQEASMGAQVWCACSRDVCVPRDACYQDRLIKETADRKNELESYVRASLPHCL